MAGSIARKQPDISEAGEVFWVSTFADSHPSAAQPATANPGTYSHETTGTAASTTLTTTADQTTDLGTGNVALVLKHGSSYKFANAVAVSATEIILEYPLNKYFDDLPSGSLAVTVYGRYEGSGDSQHLSDAGNRANGELLFTTNSIASRQHQALRFIEAVDKFVSQSNSVPSPQSWQPSPTITGNEVTFYSNLNMSTSGVFHSLHKRMVRFLPTADGEYATYTTNVDRQDCIVDITAGVATNVSPTLHGRVQVLADDEEVYSSDFFGAAQRHVVRLTQVSKIEVRVMQVGAGAPMIRIDSLAILAPLDRYERPIRDSGTVLVMGDSWTDEQGLSGSGRPGFAERLRELTSARINTDYAVGSTTIKYGWAWLPTAVAATNPDTVVFHYGINDSNSIDGTNIANKLDPDGASIDINIASAAEYWSLASKCIGYCTSRGIRVVFMGYPCLASTSQVQEASDQGMLLGAKMPILVGEHINEATSNEIADVDSRINVKGKHSGRNLKDVVSGDVLYATGSAAADPWEPLRTDGTAVTPS